MRPPTPISDPESSEDESSAPAKDQKSAQGQKDSDDDIQEVAVNTNSVLTELNNHKKRYREVFELFYNDICTFDEICGSEKILPEKKFAIFKQNLRKFKNDEFTARDLTVTKTFAPTMGTILRKCQNKMMVSFN